MIPHPAVSRNYADSSHGKIFPHHRYQKLLSFFLALKHFLCIASFDETRGCRILSVYLWVCGDFVEVRALVETESGDFLLSAVAVSLSSDDDMFAVCALSF